jgi:hypothetical protein
LIDATIDGSLQDIFLMGVSVIFCAMLAQEEACGQEA